MAKHKQRADLQRLSDDGRSIDVASPSDALDLTEQVLRALAQDKITAGPRFKQQLIMTLQATSRSSNERRQPWHLRALRWALGVVLLVLLMWGGTPRAPERAILTVRHGSAMVTWSRPVVLWWQRHGQEYVDVAQNLSIAQGDHITISEDGDAVLTLFEGSRIELRPGTRLTLTEATPGSPRRPLTVRVRVTSGEIRTQRQPAPTSDERFELETPAAVIHVQGRMALARVVGPNHTYGATDAGPLRVHLDDPAQGELLAEVPSGHEVDAVIGQPLEVRVSSELSQPLVQSIMVTPTAVYTDDQTAEVREPPQIRQEFPTVALAPTETLGAGEQASPSLGLVDDAPRVQLTPTLADVTGDTMIHTATVASTTTQVLTETEVITTTEGFTETQRESEETGEEVVEVVTPDDVLSRAEIGVFLRDTPDPVLAGDSLVYTLVVTNDGPGPAHNVVVTHILSSKVRFITASPSPMISAVDGRKILLWNLKRLTAGETRMLSVVVQVSHDVTGTLRTVAMVSNRSPVGNRSPVSSRSPVGGGSIEDELANNTANELTVVSPPPELPPPVEARGADLWLAPFDGLDVAPAGGVVTYTLAYTNSGPASAKDVVLMALLPPEMRFGGEVKAAWPLTLTAPAGWMSSTWNLETLGPPMTLKNLRVPAWTTPTLPPGGTGHIVFTATLNPGKLGTLTTRFAMTSTVLDEHPTNNLGSARLNVMRVADLAITGFSSPDPAVSVARAGSVLTYTLVYTNAGPWDARSVLITDVLPTGVTYGGLVYADPPAVGPTVRDRRQSGRVQALRWFVSELPVGAHGTLVFTTTLLGRRSDGIPLCSQVTIAGSVLDQNSANNAVVLATDVRMASLLVRQSLMSDTRGDPLRSSIAIVPRMPLTYTVWVTNTGQVTLTTRMVQRLSPGFHYVVGSGWPRDPVVVSRTVETSAGTLSTVGVSPTGVLSPTAALSPAFALVWDEGGALSPGQQLSVSFAVKQIDAIATAQPVTYVNPTWVTGTVLGARVTVTDAVAVHLKAPSLEVAQRVTGYKLPSDRGVGVGRYAPIYMTFTVRISNTGPSAIDVLPLRYIYDPAYLRFVSAEPYADVVTQDGGLDDGKGVLIWHDVSTPTLSPLSPDDISGRINVGGRGLTVTVVFSSVRPPASGYNMAIVSGALDIYQNAVAEVRESVPFPLIAELDTLRARRVEGQVRLTWAAVEIDDLGYRVLRALEPRFRDAVDIAFMSSQCRQALCEATYVYTDALHTADNALPWYWVIAVDALGDERRYGPVAVWDPTPPEEEGAPTLFLPILMRGA